MIFRKGLAPGVLDRNNEEIADYDDLLARFSTATELPLRELVTKVKSIKKGVVREL